MILHSLLTQDNLLRIRSYKVTEKFILLTVRILPEREVFVHQAELCRHIWHFNLIVPSFRCLFRLSIWDHRHPMLQIEFCEVHDHPIDGQHAELSVTG